MTADMKTKEIKKKPECSKFPITKIIKCIRIHPLNWKERVFITNEIGKYLDQMQAEEDEINQEKLVRVFPLFQIISMWSSSKLVLWKKFGIFLRNSPINYSINNLTPVTLKREKRNFMRPTKINYSRLEWILISHIFPDFHPYLTELFPIPLNNKTFMR